MLCYTTPTRASNRCRLKSFTSCAFCGRLAAPDFVMKCTEARAVQGCSVWKFYGSLTSLHFPTGGTHDAQNVRVDIARREDNDHQNFAMYITRWLQMSEDKIILFISSWRATNKLQLVLINVLIRTILNTKVLQGSVSTHLRYDGIFNDQFVIQSPLSPKVKKMKIGHFADVMGN